MNVDEATAYASKDKCFWAGEVHTALETLAKEVERLRAEVEIGNSFHRVAVKERDLERLLVEALKEELAAAQAASKCPVKVNAFGSDGCVGKLVAYCDNADAAKQLYGWLRDRMKDTTPSQA